MVETHQLEYLVFSAPGGIRTPGPLLRRQLLYPSELLGRFWVHSSRLPASVKWGLSLLFHKVVLAFRSGYAIIFEIK